MWSRVVEVMLGCWLAVSPFVFRHGPEETLFWVNDLSCASAVILFALLSFWHPLRRAHLAVAVVGVWMIAFGYLHIGTAIPPAIQNNVLTGFFLLMFGIIPNRATEPPAGWQTYASIDQEHRGPQETAEADELRYSFEPTYSAKET